MYKHILVAVDGSKVSTLALKEAVKLVKTVKTKLTIIYVADEVFYNSGELYIDIPKYQAAIRKEGQIILKKMMAIAQKAAVKAESHLLEINELPERIPAKIMGYAKKAHTDLLVIGTHGRRGFRRIMLGSVAEEVIRIASMPVLLIRGKEK